MFNFKNRVKNAIRYVEPNIMIIGIVGVVGFPLYYLIWQYIFPQAYENLFLRAVGMILFIPLLLFKYLPKCFKKYFHWYFFLSSMYALPFFFSFMLFKNEFSFIWSMSALAGLSFLIIIFYDWLLIYFMVFFGLLLAYLSVWLVDGAVYFNNFQLDSIPIYLFGLIGGVLFSYRTEMTNSARLDMMRSLAGSISHELRNPLNAINLATSQLHPTAAKIENEEIRKSMGLDNFS